MLSATITNKGEDTIRNAVVAFVARDKNGLLVKIVPQYNFDGGYIRKVNYSDANIVPGASYGEDRGLSLYYEEQKEIGSFKACVVSYETWDGKAWENPYYSDFSKLNIPEIIEDAKKKLGEMIDEKLIV